MTSVSKDRPSRILWICMIGAILVLAGRSFVAQDTPLDIIATSDNDDIMRLLSVRAFLAGQGWFDMVQYRILPPDGLPMHWSRFIDLGIAGMMKLTGLVLPPDQAEMLTLRLWPLLVFTLLVLLSGLQTRHIFGTTAAALTVLALVMWPVTSHQYFRIARLDHHNVQILLTTAMLITLIRPGAPIVLGLIGGAAGAASLAIGLETVPLVGLAGLILVIRALREPEAEGTHLLTFAGTLTLGAVALFLAQTPPSDWTTPYCDQLSPSALSLVVTAAMASVLLVISLRRGSLATGLVLLAGTVILGVFLASPILRPCLVGPYATLPDEVRKWIGVIVEVQPAHSFLRTNPGMFFQNIAPGLGALIVASLAWWFRLRNGMTTAVENRAVGTLLVFGAITVAGTFIQIRIMVLTAPAVPMLIGYGLGTILSTRLKRPSGRNALALIAGTAVTMLPQLIDQVSRRAYYQLVQGTAPPVVDTTGDTCRLPDILRTLNDLPPGVILHPSNLGPPIVLLTHHDALAGPYHRRPDAIVNGLTPFAGDEDRLRSALRETGADYLVLCRGVSYSDGEGPSFAARIAEGLVPDGFTEVPGLDPELVVLRPPDP